MFYNTRLEVSNLRREALDVLSPGDMALVGVDSTARIRCASADPVELWYLDCYQLSVHDFQKSANRAVPHLAVRAPRYFVQLGAPVRGRAQLTPGTLASTDDGPLVLVVHSRSRENFDEQRWIDIRTWTLKAPDYEVVGGPGRPMFHQWELWGAFPGGMHGAQAELVARGPGVRETLHAVDSRH